MWLATYDVGPTIEYLGYIEVIRVPGHPPIEPVPGPPWWSAWAADALLAIGLAIAVWLLPGHPHLIRRLGERLAKPSSQGHSVESA
jgi:hypothetical protein